MASWTFEELEILYKYYVSEANSIVARIPQHTWRAIREKAHGLGLYLRGIKEPIWTDKDLQLLKLLRKTKTVRQLSSFFPDRSDNALWLKCERMGFSNVRNWDKVEEEVLKIHFTQSEKNILLDLLPKRSWAAIKQKAKKLGLPKLGHAEIQRQRFKKLNKAPEYNKKRLQALCQKPTKPERQLIDIIRANGFPYKYVGDGSFIIEGLNPDFVNINGKKNIIEVFGRVWHEYLVKDWNRTELGRMMVFGSYGYKTLIIWDDELNDNVASVVEKIRIFENYGRNYRRSNDGRKAQVRY